MLNDSYAKYNFHINTSPAPLFFESYMRYKQTAMILSSVAKKYDIESPSILEIGSHGTNVLGGFFPQARVTLSDKTISNAHNHTDNFLVLDATDMRELADNSFDFVISLAVLEHVPQELHKQFLSELYRVSKIGVFVVAPFDDDFLLKAERRVGDYHKLMLGQKHRWLEEHLEIGHPNLSQIKRALSELGCDYCIFEHGDIDIWEMLFKLSIAAKQYDRSLWNCIQTFYIEQLFYQDSSDTNFFTNIYISKKNNHISEVSQFYKDTFSRLANKKKTLNLIFGFQSQIMELMTLRLNGNQRKQISDQKEYFKKQAILNYVDYLQGRQSCIYLYGVTRRLLLWFETICSARPDRTVKILDTYKTGSLAEYGSIYRGNIERPDAQELKGKSIVVFPEFKYAEIFEYLYSIEAKPALYKTIISM